MEILQKSAHPLQATIELDRENLEVFKTYECKSFGTETHPEKKIYDLLDEGHENICKLLRFERTNFSQTLVLEFVPFDLSRKALEKQQVQKVFSDICKGLAFLHKKGIIHADLKPSNILFDGDRARLCDFGLSLYCGEGEVTVNYEVVTLNYRPPELLLEPTKFFGKEIDIWSLGCVLSELWNGRPLWSFSRMALIRQHVQHRYAPKKSTTDSIEKCIFDLLRYKAEERPTIVQVLEKYC
nr:serine/threonine protein kinase [Marseillevirus futianmevirus]